MEEEDLDTHSTSQERIRRLGFKPQKELVYNHILPYADELDDESTRLFSEIKTYLGKNVMIKEMRPGCGVWTSRLMKYIKLYGLKFSKEDHINLIYLVYELITIPDLEPTKLHKFCTLLILLTKKKHLITPKELSLPWRPLYDIAQKIFSKSSIYHFSGKRDSDEDERETTSPIHQLLEGLGIEVPYQLTEYSTKNDSLESTFDLLIYCVKPYFPLSATREILDEILPKFNPWNASNQDTIQHLMVYLPNSQPPEDMNKGFRLWFDDLMEIWNVCNNGPAWESEMMVLMANTAFSNIGYIDWEPHIPLMFTRFLRSFNLPVFYKQTQNNRQQSIDICGMALWIVSILGPNSSGQKYLDNFMTTVVTYLHNANTGRWSVKLRELVRRLPYHFVQRVHKQRTNYKNTWENKVPDSHKLTDDDITAFVECMLNVALQAMFSRAGVNDACVALQQLAVLRPALVVAPTIEKMWNTLDSLTEPHKLTCAMQCVVAVARPLVSGYSNGYPEGPTHVIPLLFSSLPGLDPNDFKKTLVTLHFISVFCTFIPLVDCSGASKYWKDLTEEEHTVCEATAQIEDFVLQFFERVFILVESSVMENTRMEQKDAESMKNKLEATSEGVLASASVTILMQTSTDIFKLALKKFHTFVTQRILEINVAGMTAASLGRAFARVNARETFKIFIPYLCDTIMDLLGEGDEILKGETLDNDLLFNLLLLSHIVERDGAELLMYIPRLLAVLDKTLTLSCKDGYTLASTTLNYIISAMCNIYPQEFRSSTKDYDSGVKNFLAVREWGKPGNLWKCDIKWHVPSKEEIECVQTILKRYLPKEIEKLQNHMNGTAKQTREEMHRTLSIIKCILAANPVLPPLEEERIVLMESKLPTSSFKITNGIHGSVTMPGGGNVRMAVASTIHELQKQLLDSNEDDTKNLCSIIAIWDQIVTYSNFSSSQFEGHLKAFTAVKRTLEDRLVGRPGHPRALLADRALLQQEFRAQSGGGLTQSHANIMRDLVTLATSRYSAVRIRAQARLNWMISHFTYSYNAIISQLVECLAVDPEMEHERLKGALYCLLGPKQTPVVTRHDWKVPATLWPAIVHSKPSEKLSVIRLLDHIVSSVQLHFPTITIYPKWSQACTDRAKLLLSEAELNDPDFIKLVEESDDTLKRIGEENANAFKQLMEVLVQGAESTQLHWRHSMMCVSLLPSLMHLDIKYSTRAVNLMMHSLIHDSILIRKMAVKLLSLVLKQRKKKHKKVDVDPFQMAKITKVDDKLIPGSRPDNVWLQFDNEKQLTEEEWNKTPYLHKECYGFYNWPKPFQMYAAPLDQPEFESPDSFDECDRAIYDFFSNKDYVNKLIKFFTMEDKKGKDKFNAYRFALFKRLFRIYGDAFLPMYLEHLRTMVSDKQEAVQRCGAELLAGILKGTKHWPYEKVEALKVELIPIIQAALENMTTENVADWGTCFATASERMDLSRLPWVVSALSGGWDGQAGGAGGLGGRLYALQAAVAQHSWRGARYAHRLLDTLKEHNMLWHPYQLIRDRVASLMANIFEVDVTFPGGTQDVGPSISLMMEEIAGKLDILLVEGMKGVSGSNDHRLVLSNKCVNFFPNGNSNDNESEMIVDIGHGHAKPNSSKGFVTDSMRAIIQSTVEKGGVEKGTINMATVGKIMQELKKSNLLNADLMKDSENGKNSPLDGLMSGFLDSKGQNSPIVNMLENNFASSLTLSEDNQINGDVSNADEELSTEQDSEYDVSLRFFKTAVKWVICAISRSSFGARSPYYVLVPAACALGSKEGDEELCRLCGTFLSSLAQSLHTPQTLIVALQTVEKVCDSPSWCARASCLGFLQSLVFHNMALVSANSANEVVVVRIVVRLMADSRPEVRETAAQVMAGLLHCGVAENQQKLLEHFKSLCKGRLSKGPGATEALVRRHCGVLGLCAFIAAHPYSVPPHLPEIFSLLGRHLNDPLPIPSTIRKTLGDFKRTHHDDWQNHQLKFTEDELCLLSDLTVPPSYYA